MNDDGLLKFYEDNCKSVIKVKFYSSENFITLEDLVKLAGLINKGLKDGNDSKAVDA
jgi:hypothetical protein